MATTTLLASALMGLATALLYGYVGYRVGRRELSGDAAGANQAFVLWWMALAAITGSGAFLAGAAAFGFTNVNLHVALTLVLMAALFTSLWGLGYYLAYLFTGRTWTGPLLAVFYGAYMIWVFYLIWQAHPVGVDVGPWSATLEYEHELTPAGTQQFLLLLLLMPQIIGALAYASLYFRVESTGQRYRIVVISLTILVWFGSSIVAVLLGFNDWYGWPVLSRMIGLMAAGAILAAFSPPRWVQRRYGVEADGASAPRFSSGR